MPVQTLQDLANAGQAAWDRGDFEALETSARDLLARAEAEGDHAKLALGHRFLGAARLSFHDEATARSELYQAMQLFSEIGDHVGAANVMLSLGTLAMELNMDPHEAHGLYTEALALLRAHGNQQRIAVALGNLAEVYRQEGDYRRAMQHATESLTIFRELHDSSRAAWQLTLIAHLHALRRNDASAVEYLNQAYDALKSNQNPKWISTFFDVWFMLATRLERWEIAAMLEGFIEHYRDVNHIPRLLGLFPWFAPCVERLYESVPPVRIEELRTRGTKLSVEEAIELTADIRRDDAASA